MSQAERCHFHSRLRNQFPNPVDLISSFVTKAFYIVWQNVLKKDGKYHLHNRKTKDAFSVPLQWAGEQAEVMT